MGRNISLDNLLEAIFEGVDEGIAVINSQGVIEKCNERLQKILNLSEKEIIESLIKKLCLT